MTKLIVFGTSNLSKVISYYIDTWRIGSICAYTVDGAYRRDETYLGKPLIDLDKLAREYPPDEYLAFVAVGYSNQNRNRADKVQALAAMGYKSISIINPAISRSPYFTHGDNCLVMPDDSLILPDVHLGPNVVISGNCFIGHDVRIGDNSWISAGTSVGGETTIGRNCFIGLGATINNGVTIGNNCVIGIGATVKKSLKDNSSAIAQPSKIVDDSYLTLTASIK